MAIYSDIITIIWFLFIVYWFVSALSAKKNTKSVSWTREAGLRLLIIVVVIVLLRIPFLRNFIGNNIHDHIPLNNPVFGIFGVVLTLLGLAFAIWARVYLGRNWGMPMTLKQEPELVTSGPYTYVRHPIYSGILFGCLGSTLVVGMIWLVPFILFGIYFIYSVKIEEKNMMKQFPKQYPPYKKRTKVFIPFVI